MMSHPSTPCMVYLPTATLVRLMYANLSYIECLGKAKLRGQVCAL